MAINDDAAAATNRVRRKAMLIPPLLFALWLLTDDETNSISQDGGSVYRHHHLAAMTALRRHPPCLRVYRALMEVILGLFCASVSLRVWENTKGMDDGRVIGSLLFRPPPGSDNDGDEAKLRGMSNNEEYVPVSASEDDEDSLNEDGKKEHKENAHDPGWSTDEVIDLSCGGGDEVPLSACDAANRIGSEDYDLPITPPPSTSSKASFTYSEEYRDNGLSSPRPPTSASVMGASIDLLLVTLVSLFLFTISSAEGGRYIDNIRGGSNNNDGDEQKNSFPFFEHLSEIAAPIFPLALFFVATTKVLLPWRKRKGFWTIISLTVCAPYHDVTFRDGFIGDILTSTVRPLQDIAFTTFYLFSGLQGWWSKSYGINDAAVPVERSWLLHTVVLPGCMISPLWWRFLQNLRQSYDAKARWPYLGNALKYFVAAEVALFGLFDPSKKQSVVWIASFFFATLYQVWWDVFMDWELLVWRDAPVPMSSMSYSNANGVQPSSSSKIWWPFALRKQRLYQWRTTYYFIFVINFLLRFCWTLSFIPMRYLSQSGILVDHFRSDFQTLVGPAMASAEIVRRTLWGFLRVELEAIKNISSNKQMVRSEMASPDTSKSLRTQNNQGNSAIVTCDEEDQQWELKPMSIECAGTRQGGQSALTSLRSSLRSHGAIVQSDMSSSSDLQILCELCVYATAFTSLGIIAAAHRQVM